MKRARLRTTARHLTTTAGPPFHPEVRRRRPAEAFAIGRTGLSVELRVVVFADRTITGLPPGTLLNRIGVLLRERKAP